MGPRPVWHALIAPPRLEMYSEVGMWTLSRTFPRRRGHATHPAHLLLNSVLEKVPPFCYSVRLNKYLDSGAHPLCDSTPVHRLNRAHSSSPPRGEGVPPFEFRIRKPLAVRAFPTLATRATVSARVARREASVEQTGCDSCRTRDIIGDTADRRKRRAESRNRLALTPYGHARAYAENRNRVTITNEWY